MADRNLRGGITAAEAERLQRDNERLDRAISDELASLQAAAMERAAQDRITTPPSQRGTHGLAWTVPLPETRSSSAVAVWLIEAPWAHPLWHSYAVSLVHLRPTPDKARFNIHLPGATHELLLMALSPEYPRQAMIDSGDVVAMAPANFAAQFIAEHDAAAMERIEKAIQMVCDGELSPDSDFRWQWAALFGDNMLKR